MDLGKVIRDERIVGGLALLLALDLILFPWLQTTSSAGAFLISTSSPATGGPAPLTGVLAVLAALAVLADLVMERSSADKRVPAIGGSRTMTRFVLAVAAAAFMALKSLLHLSFGEFRWGFYLGWLLVATLLLATLRAHRADVGSRSAPPRSEEGNGAPQSEPSTD